MTEEEAKTRWCPFANTRIINAASALASDRCIGAQCMAWRWDKQPVKAGDELYERTYRDMVSDTYTITIAESDVPGDGHCGLAGNPTRG